MDNSGSSTVTAGTDFPGAGSRTWRPARALILGLAGLSVPAAAGAVLPREPLDRLVAAAVCLALLAVALIGARRRLVGGPRGLLIGGLSGSRIVPWSAVRSVGCGRSRRMGSSTLEIDLVDDELIIFGRAELGSDPAEVSAALNGWFARRPESPASGA